MIQSKQYLNYMNTIKKGYVLVNVNLYNKINFEIPWVEFHCFWWLSHSLGRFSWIFYTKFESTVDNDLPSLNAKINMIVKLIFISVQYVIYSK